MARCHPTAATVAAAALLVCLVGQAAAQTTFNTTIGFFDATPILVYGQKQAYRLGLPTPLTQSATPPTAGTATYINGTASPLAAFALSAGQFNPQCTNTNCQNVFTFADTAVLSAGLYNALHVTYSGGTANGVTYTAADSRAQGLADFAFQILPASTQFLTKFTAFTLANFTSAINVNITNLNSTGVVPAGAVYAAFYKDPTGANTLIGNFSMGLVPVGANTVHLTFPSSFDATTLLKTPGKYALVETYYPTPDFTQPVPLTVQFTVTASPATPPPPPPPPPGPPSPPAPPSPPTGGLKTTITLEVFFTSAAYGRRLLGGYGSCDRSGTLSFVTAIRGPTAAQYPADGTVSFVLQPGSVALGSKTVVPDAAKGASLAQLSIPFVDQATYAYAAHTVTATYSGSSNGVYLPAEVTVNFVIPSCPVQNKKEAIVDHVIDTINGALISEPYSGPGYGYAASSYAGTVTTAGRK